MKNKRFIVLAIVVILAVAGGAVWYAASHKQAEKTPSSSPSAALPKNNVTNKKATAEQRQKPHQIFGKSIVLINESIFGPSKVTVMANSVVEWSNMEKTTHQVVTDDGTTITAAASPVLNQGQSYDFTFVTPGTYAYHDNLHPKTQGTITVK